METTIMQFIGFGVLGDPPTLRVGWLPKAERVKTLFLSPLQPGGGGVGGVSRLRFPPGPHLQSSRFSRHPRLRQAPARRFCEKIVLCELGGFCGEKAQAPGGPGPKPWGPGPQAPWRPGPQAPGAWIPPLSPVNQVLNFLLRLKPMGPGLKTLP